MSVHLDLEKAIRNRLPGYCWGQFPSADIKKIRPENTMDLHTAFDLYFADVAGYTVNVKAMRRKPRSELLQIRDRLSQSFFERYKQFDQHRASITPDLTPELYRHFVAVEENRLDLIRLIETLLQSGHEGGGRKD